MSRLKILTVEFRDNVSLPGYGRDTGDLSTHMEDDTFDLSFDTVLGCLFGSRTKVPEGREQQVRMYPTSVIASMVYAPDPAPAKK